MIEPGKTATARLNVGQKFDDRQPANLKMRLPFRGLRDTALVKVTLNGHPLKIAHGADDWFEGVPASADLREGSNKIAVGLSPKAAEQLVWSDLVLEVRQPAP